MGVKADRGGGSNLGIKGWLRGCPFGMLPFCTQNPVDSCAKIVIEENQKDRKR